MYLTDFRLMTDLAGHFVLVANLHDGTGRVGFWSGDRRYRSRAAALRKARQLQAQPSVLISDLC
jgi:hypothetical protein